jgi:hypothetical protein
MGKEDIAEEARIMAEELGQYIETNQGALPRYESLPIVIKVIMDQLYYDTLLEKDGVLDKAVREYREED